ncbi:hypothetical protein [Crossiella sp. NPDC003009]
MERIVNLDVAAQQIVTRRAAWELAGFTVGPLTWRDHSTATRELTTDRAAVADPDSVGVTLDFGDWPAAVCVLFRGGWADVDVVDFRTKEARALDGRGVTSPAVFGERARAIREPKNLNLDTQNPQACYQGVWAAWDSNPQPED